MGDNVRAHLTLASMPTHTSETQLALIAPAPPKRTDKVKERRALERRHTEPNLIERLVNPRDSDRRADERRATPRVEVELECEELSEGARFFRITQDLSTFGLSTRQGFPYEKGARMELALHLPDEAGVPVRLTAEVVGPYDERGGTRLAFRQPSPQAVKRIHKFLLARVPELPLK